MSSASDPQAHITVRNLTMAYGSFVLMRDLTFTVRHGDVFVIMGGSGCGKSTMLRRFGVLYQSGALWSSMTLAENIGLPLGEYTDLTPAQIREVASLKLALVGLKGFEDFFPSQISGGMQKRAGLARAMALDPDILFFDEPSAGLDPISSQLLDDLILELRESLGSTIVVVTHELASIFAIATNSVFLDADSRAQIASGDPHDLLRTGNDTVRRFLRRGASDGEKGAP